MANSIRAKELIRILERLGFNLDRIRGSHHIYRKPGSTGITGHLVSLSHEPHNYPIFYVQLDGPSAPIARAVELGGEHLLGLIPAGNTVGLFKPAPAH